MSLVEDRPRFADEILFLQNQFLGELLVYLFQLFYWLLINVFINFLFSLFQQKCNATWVFIKCFSSFGYI